MAVAATEMALALGRGDRLVQTGQAQAARAGSILDEVLGSRPG